MRRVSVSKVAVIEEAVDGVGVVVFPIGRLIGSPIIIVVVSSGSFRFLLHTLRLDTHAPAHGMVGVAHGKGVNGDP